MQIRTIGKACGAAAIAMLAGQAMGQCERVDFAVGIPGFGFSGASRIGDVTDAIVFDLDGSTGPNPARLIATGNFDVIGLVSVPQIAVYDGLDWSAFPAGIGAAFDKLFTYDRDGAGPADPVLLGSYFTTLYAWNGTTSTWNAVARVSGGAGTISTITAHDFDGPGPAPAEMVIGGSFTFVSNSVTGATVEANNIAVNNPLTDTWRALGPGITGATPGGQLAVLALASYDSDGIGPQPAQLYVAGEFSQAGRTLVDNITRWTDAPFDPWAPLAVGVDGRVSTLSVNDLDGPGPGLPTLFVGGNFQNAGGVPSAYVGAWNGASWVSGFGVPYAGSGSKGIIDFIQFDPDAAGPIPTKFVSLFDGNHDAEFRRWNVYNGSTWEAYGPASYFLNGSASYAVRGVAFDPDASGRIPTQLYSFGYFDTTTAQIPFSAYNYGHSWSVSQWGCRAGAVPPPPPPPPACLADCNQDGVLDIRDFSCFQNRFAVGCP